MIDSLLNRKDILGLIKQDGQYQSLVGSLAKYEYLSTLSEDSLYTYFRTALQMSPCQPFSQFTTEHKDAFVRLKFKSIDLSKEDPMNNLHLNNTSVPESTLLEHIVKLKHEMMGLEQRFELFSFKSPEIN